jgi:hypothetical protein
MAARLTAEFDLQEVSVNVDSRGRARVVAAPPSAGVSNRLEAGTRAVSIDALVPTGVARGDVCTVLAGGSVVQGTVVSAKSDPKAAQAVEATGEVATEADEAEVQPDEPRGPPSDRAPTTTGGRGRVTVAVSPSEAETLLASSGARIVIESRGTRREFELVSMLRRSGQGIERVTIDSGGPLAGETLAEAGVRDAYGVAILAHRHEDGWQMAPRGETTIAGGDEVFVVGPGQQLRAFREAVA